MKQMSIGNKVLHLLQYKTSGSLQLKNTFLGCRYCFLTSKNFHNIKSVSRLLKQRRSVPQPLKKECPNETKGHSKRHYLVANHVLRSIIS